MSMVNKKIFFGEERALVAGFALFFALAAGAAPRLAAADWPMFRGNAGRTGFSSEQAYPPLTKLWEFRAGGPVASSPVVYEDMVFFGARDNRLYAFYADTGEEAWRFQAGGWIDASPAVSETAAYAVSTDGNLYALDRRTGAFRWRAALGAPSFSSPLLYGGKVYVGVSAPENKLKAFDAATGAPAGEYAVAQPVDSSPSTDGTKLYFGANDGRLYALDRGTLAQAWTYQTMGGRYGRNAAAVRDGAVYALPGYDENKPLALAAADGTLLNPQTGPFEEDVALPDGSLGWRQVGAPAVTGDRLYFSGGSTANLLHALTAPASNQALLYVWPSTPTLGSVSPVGLLSSPAVAGDVVYAGTVDGALVAFSSTGASIPLVADVSFSSPVYASPCVSNGLVFAAGMDGKVAAYRAQRVTAISEPAEGEIVSAWVDVNGYISNPALTGYQVEYSTGGEAPVWTLVDSSATAASVSGRPLAVWDTNALANGLYTLRLTATESAAGGPPNVSSVLVRVNAAPEPPPGLTAADVPADGGNSIALAWAASPTAAVTAYRVYRDGEQGPALLGSVSSATLSYVDPTAVTGTTFTYTVRSYDGYAESGNSEEAEAFSVNDTGDSTPPAAVTDLAVSSGPAYGMLTLTWTAPGNDGNSGAAAYYTIKRTTEPAFDWGAFDGTALEGGTRPVDGAAGTPEREETGGLYGGVTYYFALKASDAIPNLSGLSNVASACVARDPVAPAAPSGLAAADTLGDGGGSVTLAWTASADDGPAGDVYGYKVYRRLASSSYAPASPYAYVAAGVTTYIDASATENVRYYYAVTAYDSTSDSQLSAEAYAVSANNWRFFDAGAGVSLRLQDGARFEIPVGAASQNDSVMFTRLDPVTYQPMFRASAAGSANPTGVVYEVKFLGAATRLLNPAALSVPYTDADVAGMDLENVRLYMRSGGGWVMVDNSRADAYSMRVSAEVRQLGVFAVMEYVPSGELFSRDEVYTYPNPALGDTLTFKFRVSEKTSVKIDVYNVAGQRVARLGKSNCPAGVTSEIPWDIKKIASGVYQFRFEAVGASGRKSVVKRLAIVH
ncbi:MAG: PQQ-binding-like beta-propeller repeat protein [Elusimicrobiales bacterium]|nr:PQQ-binding-like beta-propeller repeat protein [Elusimicrobiales bacterium]